MVTAHNGTVIRLQWPLWTFDIQGEPKTYV